MNRRIPFSSNYLAFLLSQEIQRKVFLDGGYLTALNPENEPIDNVVRIC